MGLPKSESHPRRHSGEGRNPGKALPGCWKRAGFSWFALASALNCHPHLLTGGDVLSKPLDSGLRLPAAGRPE